MPTSMTASHGGVLYYVVKVPKARDPTGAAMDYVVSSATASHKYLEEKRTFSPLNMDADGWENPFRPDGDLSKEADQIVELIKEGKPITPTPTSAASPLLPDHCSADGKRDQPPVTSTPTKVNGTRTEKNAVPPNVEVQRGTVINGNEPSQVEHVVLKKKPKCRCCVVQ